MCSVIVVFVVWYTAVCFLVVVLFIPSYHSYSPVVSLNLGTCIQIKSHRLQMDHSLDCLLSWLCELKSSLIFIAFVIWLLCWALSTLTMCFFVCFLFPDITFYFSASSDKLFLALPILSIVFWIKVLVFKSNHINCKWIIHRIDFSSDFVSWYLYCCIGHLY